MGSCFSEEGGSRSPVRKHRKHSNSKARPSSRHFYSHDTLHRIPGRFFLNGSSRVASLFTQQGKKGTNQDAMIVWENFCSRTDAIFCGVFDGHGPFGHLVAKRVRDSLPLKLRAHWEVKISGEDVLKENSINTAGSINSEELAFVSAEEESRPFIDILETEQLPQFFQSYKDLFLKAFKVMDRELRTHPTIDCFCSGTTAVTLVKQGQNLVIGNVGDSRAVLGTRDKNDSLVAVQLTVDLKPNLPAEAERIRKCKGRVFALEDEPEVARVWLPNSDSPGLAMARALGDFCLKDFGLISVPDVSYHHISPKDEFVVLATDGIWDVLSNNEVVDIVASVPVRSSAARTLVESAVRAWRYTYPTSKVDDCAVICLFLDSDHAQKLSAASGSNSNEQQQVLLGKQVESSCEKDGSDDPPPLRSGGNVQEGKEGIVLEDSDEEISKDEVIDSESAREWSALEGVSRVNTLINLPRFVPAKQGDGNPCRPPK